MHAGYGIGAIIAVQLLKPFIRFDPSKMNRIDENRLNQTLDISNQSNLIPAESAVTADDIKLDIPYSAVCLFGMIILICFLIAQYFEIKNETKIQKLKEEQVLTLKTSSRNMDFSVKKFPFLQKLLFKDIEYRGNSIYVAFAQILLIFLMLVMVMACWNINTTFMLTFLTQGPAKFTVDGFIRVQSTIWVFLSLDE